MIVDRTDDFSDFDRLSLCHFTFFYKTTWYIFGEWWGWSALQLNSVIPLTFFSSFFQWRQILLLIWAINQFIRVWWVRLFWLFSFLIYFLGTDVDCYMRYFSFLFLWLFDLWFLIFLILLLFDSFILFFLTLCLI